MQRKNIRANFCGQMEDIVSIVIQILLHKVSLLEILVKLSNVKIILLPFKKYCYAQLKTISVLWNWTIDWDETWICERVKLTEILNTGGWRLRILSDIPQIACVARQSLARNLRHLFMAGIIKIHTSYTGTSSATVRTLWSQEYNVTNWT